MKNTTKKFGRDSTVVPALMGIVLAGVLALPVVVKATEPKCEFKCKVENGIEVCKGNGPQCDGVDPHPPVSAVKRPPTKGDEQTHPMSTRKVVPGKESMER